MGNKAPAAGSCEAAEGGGGDRGLLRIDAGRYDDGESAMHALVKRMSTEDYCSSDGGGSVLEVTVSREATSPSFVETVTNTLANWFGSGSDASNSTGGDVFSASMTPKACDIVADPPDPSWPPPLPGYTYLKKLGQGTYAVVMLAVENSDQNEGDLVAVKAIRKHMTSDEHIAREVRSLSRIRHNHVESMLGSVDGDEDAIDAPGWYFIITEYASGGELFDRIIEHGSFSEKSAAMVIAQLLDAILCLHANGIIHRDLKPENILLKRSNEKLENPHILIADFGTSKLASPSSSGRFETHLRATSYVGSLLYIAPEVFSGRGSAEYSQAVDLWSVGVILYILLSGDPPFDDANCGPIDFARMVMNGLPCQFASVPFDVPADSCWSTVSPQAQDLVRRLLTVDPSKRPSARQALNHAWFHSFGLATQDQSAFSFSRRDIDQSKVRQRSASSALYISSLRQFTDQIQRRATPKRARKGTIFKSAPEAQQPEMY